MTMFGSRPGARTSQNTRPHSKSSLLGFWLPLGLVLASASFAYLEPCRAKGKPPRKPVREAGIDQCAQVNAGVRMEAYGFTHVVSLRNRCEKPVSCEVWTDVDPTPHQILRAGPGENDEVVTRRGSPAREVSAESSCHYE
jgi:hypothetical protein